LSLFNMLFAFLLSLVCLTASPRRTAVMPAI
jgi:hypothetical protein